MSCKVSVILPIHNGGEYLHTTLTSLQNQTLQDIEILCVLDCPTDGSDKVVEQFARNDSRFRIIINDTNLHIGESRNKGLSHARGKYIGFCDHDDFCLPEMYETLYLTAEKKGTDVVISHQCARYSDKDIWYPVPTNDFDVEQAKRALLSTQVMHENSPSYGNIRSVWNHLYRRDFIENHSIRFVDTKQICAEDTMFDIEVYLHNPKIVVVDKVLYYWNQHQSSTLHNYAYSSPNNAAEYVLHQYDILIKQNLLGEYKEEMAQCMVRKLYTAFWVEVHHSNMSNAIKQIRLIVKKDGMSELRRSIKNVRIWEILPPTKWLFYCIFLSYHR